ncbi:MAG: DoxX family protein [Armatimonadetes bacterium]|nr:DoxX family protein [Armatimonadota bacterium]
MPLRLILGGAFIYHGFPKLFDAAHHTGFEKQLAGLRVPMPEIMAWVVGIVEFFGGAALILGALVSLASLALIINMMFAMFKVHWPSGFAFVNVTGQNEAGQPIFGIPGIEVNLVFIAGLLALLIGGGGRASIDCMVGGKKGRDPSPK